MASGKLDDAKIINTPVIRVDNNCLAFRNTFIQLSNISLFSTAPVRPGYRLLADGLIMLGIGIPFSMIEWDELEVLVLVGVTLITLGVVCLFMWASDWRQALESSCLTIVTNSGSVYPIVFRDKKFMKEVVNAMINLIQNPGSVPAMTINISECTFSDDASVIDEMIDIG